MHKEKFLSRSSCILVNSVELLEVADFFVALIENSFNVRPVKSLISAEHHYMIKKVINFVHEFIVVAVFSCDNCLSSFLADLLANLVNALVEEVAGIRIFSSSTVFVLLFSLLDNFKYFLINCHYSFSSVLYNSLKKQL